MKRFFRIREFVILLCLVVTATMFYLAQSGAGNRFLTLGNLEAVLLSISLDGLMVVGMTLVIIAGGFDLSVGSTFALGGLVAAYALQSGFGVPAAILCALASGALVGAINGFVITRVKVNPLIATLGMMTIVRGIVQISTEGNSLSGFPAGFTELGQGALFGVIFYPILILAVVVVVADFLLRNNRFLRQCYLVGGNEEAARLSGIDVARVRTATYIITGILAAFAGVLTTAKTGSTSPVAGMGADLRVIAAVVIGGASLAGGQGTIFGAFLGLLLTGLITNGLGFARVSIYAEGIVSGVILIVAVMLDQLTAERIRDLKRVLTTTRNKRMERIINVAQAVIIVVLLTWLFTGSRTANDTQANAVTGGNTTNSSSTNSLTNAPVSDEEYVFIGVSVGNPYWVQSKQGLDDRARQLGVRADFRGPAGGDPTQQVAILEQTIARKPAGILIAPASDALAPAIDRAVAAGIPVICVDADSKTSKRFSYIGTGNYQAGLRGGEMLAKSIDGKGEVALLTVPGQSNHEERIRGYKDALAKFPDIQIVKISNDDGLSSEAEKVARALLQAYPNLSAFGCTDAGGGEGAAVAVKESGRAGDIRIVAMDRNEATLDFIEQGVIDATVAQRSYTMAYMGLGLLFDLNRNNIKMVDDWRASGITPVPDSIDTGTLVIDRGNVGAFRQSRAGK